MQTEITVSHAATVTVLGVLRRAIEEVQNFPEEGMDDEELITHCEEFIAALDHAVGDHSLIFVEPVA